MAKHESATVRHSQLTITKHRQAISDLNIYHEVLKIWVNIVSKHNVETQRSLVPRVLITTVLKKMYAFSISIWGYRL